MTKKEARTSVDLPDPTAVGVKAFSKSRATRTRILEAAIECLSSIGYQATSTTTVAKYAGLTRAAVLYHFPNRLALIEATVHYVTRRRVAMQEEMQVDLPRDEAFPFRSLDSQREQLQTREFFAFSELAMAARTDPELDEIFRPAMESFDHARRDMANKLASDEVKSAPGFDLRRDVARFALEGLIHQDGITFDQERRTSQMMWLLKLLFDPKVSGELVQRALEMSDADLA
ncbi:MAG: TetR/AcrR family transcriptional regulator [Pseudomonadaceae bacterium]|nr:TetR/AcrR family transcriptional regulator [Pseudomonadaceae bacterium]